ncbi:MAG: hypothetical protein WKF87_02820 [Chryseolinea sp.]
MSTLNLTRYEVRLKLDNKNNKMMFMIIDNIMNQSRALIESALDKWTSVIDLVADQLPPRSSTAIITSQPAKHKFNVPTSASGFHLRLPLQINRTIFKLSVILYI